jgi:hypothetical protein
MKIWQRILAVVMMVLSVLLAIVCVGGIVGGWVISSQLSNGIARVATGVDAGLARAEDALGRLDGAVGNARDRVAEFDEAVETAGENFVENPVILTAISERLDLGLGPAVEEVRGTVQNLREAIVVAQNTVQTLNALPFVSLGGKVADDSKLQALADGITELQEGVQGVRDGVREAKAGAAESLVSRLGQRTARLDAGLETVGAAVSGFGDRASTLRTEVAALKTKLTRWLTIAAVLITLVLLWLIYTQVVAFVLGLSVYQGKNLFARWTDTPAA